MLRKEEYVVRTALFAKAATRCALLRSTGSALQQPWISFKLLKGRNSHFQTSLGILRRRKKKGSIDVSGAQVLDLLVRNTSQVSALFKTTILYVP